MMKYEGNTALAHVPLCSPGTWRREALSGRLFICASCAGSIHLGYSRPHSFPGLTLIFPLCTSLLATLVYTSVSHFAIVRIVHCRSGSCTHLFLFFLSLCSNKHGEVQNCGLCKEGKKNAQPRHFFFYWDSLWGHKIHDLLCGMPFFLSSFCGYYLSLDALPRS